jgi:DNA-binding response OmpR family regulator
MVSVFLVEDEVLIRMLVADMVQDLGHRVAAEAGTIEEGLHLARSVDFDLAILDINLGKLTADPIAHVVDQRGLPIIFASAYDLNGLPPGFAGRTLLQKPFQISHLSAAIAGAIGSA